MCIRDRGVAPQHAGDGAGRALEEHGDVGAGGLVVEDLEPEVAVAVAIGAGVFPGEGHPVGGGPDVPDARGGVHAGDDVRVLVDVAERSVDHFDGHDAGHPARPADDVGQDVPHRVRRGTDVDIMMDLHERSPHVLPPRKRIGSIRSVMYRQR